MWWQDDSRAATRRKQGVTLRRYRIDFEKMVIPELVKKSRHFMKPQILIPYPQHPPRCPYPKPDESSPHLPTLSNQF